MFKELKEVFSKKFKEKCEYKEYMQSKLDHFKLNDNAEDVEITIERLKNNNFKSNFSLGL